MFLKNFKKFKVCMLLIMLVSIFFVSNLDITFAFEPGTVVNFKINHDYQDHQEVETYDMTPETVIDLTRYERNKDGYKAVYYSIKSPITLKDYKDDKATIRYEKIETQPAEPTPPPLGPTLPPTPPPLGPTPTPPTSNEGDAYIYVYHESTAGHHIFTNETVKGKSGETLDLRNYIRDAATYKHYGFNPSSGIVTFDSKRRQKTAVIYEKDYKPAKDSQTYPKPNNNQTKPNEDIKNPIGNNNTNNPNNQNNPNNPKNPNYISPIGNINNQNVTENNVNEAIKYIRLSKNRNIKLINGYPDNSMKPSKPVSREEVAFSLYKLLDESYKSMPNQNNINLKDVDSSRWSYDAISKLVNEDIMQNISEGEFRPKENATRGQVAMAISGIIYEGGDIPMNAEFSDTNGNMYEPAIAYVTSKGLMSGYPDGTFRPEKSITRVEFIVVLNRLMGRTKSDIVNNINFNDVKPTSWYYNEVQMAVQGQ